MRVAYTHDGREVWAVWQRIKAPGLKNNFKTERCNIFSSPSASDSSIILNNESIDFNTFIEELNVNGVKDYQWRTHAYVLWKERFGEATWRHEDGRKRRKRKRGRSGSEERMREEVQEEVVNIRPAMELEMFAPIPRRLPQTARALIEDHGNTMARVPQDELRTRPRRPIPTRQLYVPPFPIRHFAWFKQECERMDTNFKFLCKQDSGQSGVQ
jgi:hypothetical protein